MQNAHGFYSLFVFFSDHALGDYSRCNFSEPFRSCKWISLIFRIFFPIIHLGFTHFWYLFSYHALRVYSLFISFPVDFDHVHEFYSRFVSFPIRHMGFIRSLYLFRTISIMYMDSTHFSSLSPFRFSGITRFHFQFSNLFTSCTWILLIFNTVCNDAQDLLTFLHKCFIPLI